MGLGFFKLLKDILRSILLIFHCHFISTFFILLNLLCCQDRLAQLGERPFANPAIRVKLSLGARKNEQKAGLTFVLRAIKTRNLDFSNSFL